MYNTNKNHPPLPQKPFLSFIVLLLIFFIPFKSYGADLSFCSGQLSNGLTYYIHHDPYSKKHTSLDLIIKTGSLDEQEDERGFSHLIEHHILHQMEFKGKKLTDLRCELWDYTLPDLGGITSYDFTQYHLEISRAISMGLQESLLGFSNVLSQFSLEEHELSEMKEELLNEMDKNQLSPIESWKQWRIEQEYPPYRNKHPSGEQEAISEASLPKIHQFYRNKYQPNRIALIIVGNVDIEKTKDLIENHFGSLPNTAEKETSRPPLESVAKKSYVYVNKRLKNTFISLAKPLPRLSQRDSLAFSILTQLLSEHLRSCIVEPTMPFFNPILETLVYPKMFRLTVSLRDVEEGIGQLKNALESFFDYPITDEQLDQIKARIKNNLKIIREKGNDSYLIDFYRDHFILNASSLENDHPDLRECLLKSIQAETINQMLRSFKGFSEVSLGSFDENIRLVSTKFLSEGLLKNEPWRIGYVD